MRNVRLPRSNQLGLAFKLGELPDHLCNTGTSSTVALRIISITKHLRTASKTINPNDEDNAVGAG
jgi:hypothetical protein